MAATVRVEQVDPTARWTRALLAALDEELGAGGYTAGQQFGYDVTQLLDRGVVLVGAFREGALVGVGGVEVTGDHGSTAGTGSTTSHGSVPTSTAARRSASPVG